MSVLSALLYLRGITHKQFAATLGCSERYVGAMLVGGLRKQGMIERAAAFFGITVELLNREIVCSDVEGDRIIVTTHSTLPEPK